MRLVACGFHLTCIGCHLILVVLVDILRRTRTNLLRLPLCKHRILSHLLLLLHVLELLGRVDLGTARLTRLQILMEVYLIPLSSYRWLSLNFELLVVT